MPLEIERKFLVSAEPPEAAEARPIAIEQGYLAVSERAEVRLRRAAGRMTLTVKVGHGEDRGEVEVDLYREQFAALWPLTVGARLQKTRRVVPLGEDLAAELDTYNGQLEGLRVVEVEFGSDEQADAFQPPAWFDEELTEVPGYANQTLATEGLPEHWQAARERLQGVSAAYHLKRKEGAAEGLRRIALGRAQKARQRLTEASGEKTADSIHGARKDLKKVRAVLRLAREGLGEKTYRAENASFRDAGRLLAESRDAEVKLQTLAALRERFGDAFPPSQAHAWAASLEADRDRVAAASGGTAARVAEAGRAIAEAERRIAEWDLSVDSWELLEPGLDRSYERGRDALAELREEGSEENVHELRKRVKDLWYQQRLLAEAWPELLEPSAAEAHRLTDLLGDHHDLAVLAEDLRGREGLAVNRAKTEALIAERQEELLTEATTLGERLYAEKPKCFRKRIRGYWRTWRAEE